MRFKLLITIMAGLMFWGRRPPEKIKALNEWMRNYVTQNKLTYLDYYPAMIDDKGFLREELSEDGLHPNAKGYAIMAPLAEVAIAKALKKQVLSSE